MYIMEVTDVNLIYAFVVTWNEVSRGVFLSKFFTSLETCMAHLQTFEYDPTQVNLECIQIKPN